MSTASRAMVGRDGPYFDPLLTRKEATVRVLVMQGGFCLFVWALEILARENARSQAAFRAELADSVGLASVLSGVVCYIAVIFYGVLLVRDVRKRASYWDLRPYAEVVARAASNAAFYFAVAALLLAAGKILLYFDLFPDVRVSVDPYMMWIWVTFLSWSLPAASVLRGYPADGAHAQQSSAPQWIVTLVSRLAGLLPHELSR